MVCGWMAGKPGEKGLRAMTGALYSLVCILYLEIHVLLTSTLIVFIIVYFLSVNSF